MKYAYTALLLLYSVIIYSNNVYAFGKSKPSENPSAPSGPSSPSQPGSPISCGTPGSNAQPVRPVVLKAVATQAFQLPNGSEINMSNDLNAILNTVVTSTNVFAPTDADANPGPCDHHIEICASLSVFELNLQQYGLTIGYNPGGSHSAVTNLTGQADVKVGKIGMDFSIWDCNAGKCSSVQASAADQSSVSVNLQLTIDFSKVTASPSFVHNTSLEKILRQIMTQGVNQIAASPRVGALSWFATIRDYNPATGVVIFDAGVRQNIQVGNDFIVYAAADVQSSCAIYKVLASVKTTQVYPISSYAAISQVLDSSRGIQAGDILVVGK